MLPVTTSCFALHRPMQIPIGLKPHPELWRRLQQARKSKRRVRCDAALAEYDFVQPIQRHAESAGRFELRQARGFMCSSSSISPGGTAGLSQFGSLAMVFEADFVRMSVLPQEGDPHCSSLYPKSVRFSGRIRRTTPYLSLRVK